MPRFNIVLEPVNEEHRKLFYQLAATALKNTACCERADYCLSEGISEPHISVIQLEIPGEYSSNDEKLIQSHISEVLNNLLRDRSNDEFQKTLLQLLHEGVKTEYNKHHFGDAKYYPGGHAIELNVDSASKVVLKKIQENIYSTVNGILIPVLLKENLENITVANGIKDNYRPHFTFVCYQRIKANNSNTEDERLAAQEGTPSQVYLSDSVKLGLGVHRSGKMWESMERIFEFSLTNMMLKQIVVTKQQEEQKIEERSSLTPRPIIF